MLGGSDGTLIRDCLGLGPLGEVVHSCKHVPWLERCPGCQQLLTPWESLTSIAVRGLVSARLVPPEHCRCQTGAHRATRLADILARRNRTGGRPSGLPLLTDGQARAL